ncbi:MAG: hypothetical protein QQN44_06115 [Nitrosopumilus sp.]
METIYKYTLKIDDVQKIKIAGFIKTLSVGVQHKKIVVYVLVNLDGLHKTVETTERCYYIIGTGHSRNFNNLRFIGTVKLMDSQLMFHVFE